MNIRLFRFHGYARRRGAKITGFTLMNAPLWLAGVDGCREGWIAAFVGPSGDEGSVAVFGRFADVLAAPQQPAIVAVDVPIGLPERSPPKGRLAESAIRPLLGARKSSVFRIPSRAAVYASVPDESGDEREQFFRASKIARETSEDGKAFSKQGFYILDKVIEVDSFLRNNREYIARIYETHPELAFWRLNGGRALSEPKKVKSRPHPPGLALRQRLLRDAGLPAELIEATPPKGAAPDDLLDALACAAVVRRVHAGTARPFPDPPPPDVYGLPMAIWA
jgi:predicted RNase H-like nuclease